MKKEREKERGKKEKWVKEFKFAPKLFISKTAITSSSPTSISAFPPSRYKTRDGAKRSGVMMLVPYLNVLPVLKNFSAFLAFIMTDSPNIFTAERNSFTLHRVTGCTSF